VLGAEADCLPDNAGPSLRTALGAPFLIAGTLKSIYDLGLYARFRHVHLDGPTHAAAASQH
jgi:hypothetical protein